MNELRRSATSSIRKAMSAGQAHLVLRFAFIAALFAAVGLFHAATRIAVVKAGYELGQASRENAELLRELEQLKMERATRRSAARLEAIAKEKLGLVPPVAGQVITLGTPSHDPGRTVAAAERPALTLNP